MVSKYAPHGPEGGPFVDSRFYSTVSMVRTMETVLGLPPMNNNDALSSMISTLFTGPGDQAPFTADPRNRENGLIFQANAKNAPGARESAKMDFRHADRADAQKLNVILWEDAMGSIRPCRRCCGRRERRARKMSTTIENPGQESDDALGEFLPFLLQPKFAERIWGRRAWSRGMRLRGRTSWWVRRG